MKLALVAVGVVGVAGCRFDFDPIAGSDATMVQPDAAATTPAAIEHVQGDGNYEVVMTPSFEVDLTSNIAAHDTIVVALFVQTSISTVTSFTDSAGDPFSILIGPFDDGGGLRFYLAAAIDVLPGGPAVQANFDTPPLDNVEMVIDEFSGIASVDGTQAQSGTNIDDGSMDSGMLTTTHARELLYAYASGSCVIAAGAFEALDNVHGDLTEQLIVDPGAHDATAYANCYAVNDGWDMFAVAFRPQLLP